MQKEIKSTQTIAPLNEPNNQMTPGQLKKMLLEQQTKTDKMNQFMRRLKPFITKMEMPYPSDRMYKHVLKENIKNAFRKNFPPFKIDYSKVIITKGNLQNPPIFFARSSATGKMDFTWLNYSNVLRHRHADLFFAGVFNRDSRQWIFYIDTTKRIDGYFVLDASKFQGKLVQVYGGFVSSFGSRFSTSLFLGEMRVL